MNKKIFMPFMAAALALGFASCANDDLLGEGSQVVNPAAGGNVAVFTNAPKAQRANGPRKTTMNAEGKFFWSQGDKIFVKNGSDYIPSNNAADTKKERENFYLSGTFTAPSYPVVFTGTGNTSHNSVTIKAQQDQAQPNDAEHIGTDGDCGNASAGKTGDGTYSFDLDHRASYLVIAPRHRLDATTVTLEKIVVSTSSSDNLCGTYTFSENTLSLKAETNSAPGKSVTSNTGSCAVPTVEAADGNNSALDADRTFIVIQPGVHLLKFAYTVLVDGVEKTYEKNVSSREFLPGHFTNVRHILAEGMFNGGHNDSKADPSGDISEDATSYYVNPNFYCWDAPADQPYDYSLWPNNQSTVAAPTQASRSCKDMPNVNEMYWYIVSGDPRWDNTTPWSNDGGLTERTGGIWIMTRAAILAAGRAFAPNVGKNNVDMRATYLTHTVATSAYRTGGRPADTSNYFFLPAQGYYSAGSPTYPGTGGYYWSSSPNPGDSANAYRLRFFSDGVYLDYSIRSAGFVVGDQWFK